MADKIPNAVDKPQGITLSGPPPMPRPESKAMVSIKYGDVMVSVQGEDSGKAKSDAVEIFSMLEERYSRHWDSKVCKERTKYD